MIRTGLRQKEIQRRSQRKKTQNMSASTSDVITDTDDQKNLSRHIEQTQQPVTNPPAATGPIEPLKNSPESSATLAR